MSISRRDFLNGTALMIGSGLAPWQLLHAASDFPYYPPALSGLRGSHPGSFEAAHQLGLNGVRSDIGPWPIEQHYDLVVVGAGISGLAAAWFYRERFPNARILLLDNHDDFGGHAKRNEFQVGGRMILGYGGSESLDSPKQNFSPQMYRLLRALGVTLQRFNKAFRGGTYDNLGLGSGIFFDHATFGRDALLMRPEEHSDGSADWRSFVAKSPLSDTEAMPLVRLFEDKTDYLSGRSKSQKLAYLRGLSYHDYLLKNAGLSATAAAIFQQLSCDEFGYRAQFLAASDARAQGYPGFAGLGLREDTGEDEPYIYHFPDGNASVARLLVRQLIPKVASGHDMEDIVLSKFDYSQLDQAEQLVRIRLNSTAVRVRNHDDGVDVVYSRAGQPHRVRGKHCVLACYNMMIPHLLEGLPEAQSRALSANVKLPLVYVNVVIRNWRSWVRLGVQEIYSPAMTFAMVKLDYPVDLGGYRAPSNPDQPICVHMVHVPHVEGAGPDLRSQARAARAKLYTWSFADYERELRDQLQRLLGPGGFEQSKDILAITVNRWPHGYSYYSNPLFDGKDGGKATMKLARRPLGRVAIANSDAGWDAYLHAAVDQAWRAVGELS